MGACEFFIWETIIMSPGKNKIHFYEICWGEDEILLKNVKKHCQKVKYIQDNIPRAHYPTTVDLSGVLSQDFEYIYRFALGLKRNILSLKFVSDDENFFFTEMNNIKFAFTCLWKRWIDK